MRSLPDAPTIAKFVTNVTRTMCNLHFVPADAGDARPDCWRLALLPIPGPRPLVVALYSDRPGCQELGAAFFSTSPDSVDDSMIDDALRELLNMAAGQIRRELVPEQALGLPRIVDESSLTRDVRAAMTSGIYLKSVGTAKLFIWIAEGALPVSAAA
jgi:hypothetical protein